MSAVELIDDADAALVVGVESAREVVHVKPVGELDLATMSILQDQVSELLAVGFARLSIDLRACRSSMSPGCGCCSVSLNAPKLMVGGCR